LAWNGVWGALLHRIVIVVVLWSGFYQVMAALIVASGVWAAYRKQAWLPAIFFLLISLAAWITSFVIFLQLLEV